MRGDGGRIARRLIASPIGDLLAQASECGVTALRPGSRAAFVGSSATAAAEAQAILDRLESELEAYFAGRLREFSVPVEFPGGASGFERKIWIQTMSIPYGQSRTYADLAAVSCTPRALRATGAALGRNPVLIVVPCHRVVPSAGGTGGFAAGPEVKEFLLRLERGGPE